MLQHIAFTDHVNGAPLDVPLQIMTNTGDGHFCLSYYARPNVHPAFQDRYLKAGDPRNFDHSYPARVRQIWR